MKLFRSVFLMVVAGLAVAGVILNAPRALGAEFTAKALIEVLPYADKDPFVLETPAIDKDLQYQFRLSMARLLTMQGNFENLLKRDRVRQTKWFTNEARELARGVENLRDNLGVLVQKESSFIEVSMTCEDAREAADIANEMVSLFVDAQIKREKARIASKLKAVHEHKNRIEDDVLTAEKAFDDVRSAWNLTDLNWEQYPHPIRVRLIRLEETKDEMALEISDLQAKLHRLKEGGKNVESERNELSFLRERYVEIERLRKEAQARYTDLQKAQFQYVKRLRIRDERIEMLKEVNRLIGKLRILYDDPDTAKVRIAGNAAKPLSPDS